MLPAERLRQPRAVLCSRLQQSGAHRAEAGDAQSQRLAHANCRLSVMPFAELGSRYACVSGARARNFLMLRAAWRMRCSFSTRAMRT